MRRRRGRWSRPGRTSAPCGRPAIALRRSAVAGIVPVEPAAMTGPAGGFRASRSASARIRVSRRTTGSTRPRSARRAGQASKAIFEEIERDLEVAGVVLRREALDLLPRDAGRLHVVHQPGEVGGEPGGVGGGGGDEQRLAGREVEQVAADGAAPGERQFGQRELARAGVRSPAAAPAGRRRPRCPGRGGGPPRRRRRSAGSRAGSPPRRRASRSASRGRRGPRGASAGGR